MDTLYAEMITQIPALGVVVFALWRIDIMGKRITVRLDILNNTVSANVLNTRVLLDRDARPTAVEGK